MSFLTSYSSRLHVQCERYFVSVRRLLLLYSVRAPFSKEEKEPYSLCTHMTVQRLIFVYLMPYSWHDAVSEFVDMREVEDFAGS